MIKKHKALLFATSLVILLPILVGLVFWNRLPQQVPFHWDINGNVDNWVSRPIAVFCMPGIMLALHWVCVLASSLDSKSRHYHRKAIQLVLWICPALSLLISTLVYATALGSPVRVEIILPLFFGLLMIVIGNLLPKMKQSKTMGIKLPWTLRSEENWNKTHRFGGKVRVLCGVVIMATAFLGSLWILLGILVIMVTVPTVYSYCLYRKQTK